MKTRNKTYISSAIILATFLAVVLFLVWPIFKDIKKESDDLISQKSEAFFWENQKTQLDKFVQNKTDFQSDIAKTEQLFADPKDSIDFIKFLEKTAKSSNVVLNVSLSSNTNQKAGQDIWTSVFFQISTEGDFFSNINFINKLENAPYLISIQNLKMNKKADSLKLPKNRSSTIQANYLIKVFSKQN